MSTKPPKSKISIEQTRYGQTWDIPAKKGVGFLMLFGCFFGGLPLVILCFSAYSMLFGNNDADSMSWLSFAGLSLFLSLFILVGVLAFYFGLKMRYTSYQVRAQGGAIEVVKKSFKNETKEKIENGNVYGVGLYSNSETNGKPDYGLLVKGRTDTNIKFSNGHKEDELRWLASDILNTLSKQGGLPTEKELEETYFHSSGHDKADNFEAKGVKITLLDKEQNSHFIIEKNGSNISKSMLAGGVFGIFFSSIFIWIGFKADDGPLIFGIVGILIAVVSFIIFLIGLFKLGTTEKFTFKSDTIIKEKLRGRVNKNKTVIQKSSIKKVEVKSSGSSNDQTRYSISLMGNTGIKILKLFRWVDQDVSDVVKYKVNTWLKQEQDTESKPSRFNSGYSSPITTESSQEEIEEKALVQPSEVPTYDANVDIKNIKGGVWIIRIVLIIFLVVGLGLTIFGGLNILTAKESESWPSAHGVILKSKITINDSSDSTTYGADVSYQYKVEGNTYKGDKVTFSEISTSSISRAHKILKRYPKGSKAKVFYDPKEPAESVLETGLSGGNWLLPGIGIAFFIIPLFMLINFEKSQRKKAKKNKSNRNSISNIQSRYGKID